MSAASLESRIRLLAFDNATIRSFLGEDLPTFRWFYIQLPLKLIGVHTCVRLRTISQTSTYLHGVPSRNGLTMDRVQIDVVDQHPSVARELADAIDSFLETADFVGNGAFASPPRLGGVGLNVKLSERGGLDYETQRPVPVISLDYRVYNAPPS